MERYKKTLKDNDTQNALEHIFISAFGNPIIFDTAPTNANIKANTWGVNGSDLYVKFVNNVTLKFTGTVVS